MIETRIELKPIRYVQRNLPEGIAFTNAVREHLQAAFPNTQLPDGALRLNLTLGLVTVCNNLM